MTMVCILYCGFVCYLSGLGLAVAQLGHKVLAVASEDAVRQLLANRRAGLSHDVLNGTRFAFFVQDVVDLPVVGSHHVPQLVSLNDGLFTKDRHDAAGPCIRNLG